MCITCWTGAMVLPNKSQQGSRENHPAHITGAKSSNRRLEVNPLKGKPQITEDELDEKTLREMEHNICKFVTYEGEQVESLYNFNTIKENTECIFAKRAKLWGSPDWKNELSLEENVLRYLKQNYFNLIMRVLHHTLAEKMLNEPRE